MGMARREDEVLSDRRPDASLSFILLNSIASFCAGFGRLALLRGMPVCFRQHLQPTSFLCVNEQVSASVRRPVQLKPTPCPIVGCCFLFVILLIYTFTRSRLSVSVSNSRLLCRRAVSLCIFGRT